MHVSRWGLGFWLGRIIVLPCHQFAIIALAMSSVLQLLPCHRQQVVIIVLSTWRHSSLPVFSFVGREYSIVECKFISWNTIMTLLWDWMWDQNRMTWGTIPHVVDRKPPAIFPTILDSAIFQLCQSESRIQNPEFRIQNQNPEWKIAARK